MFAARAAAAAEAARLAQGADSDRSDGDDSDAELVEAVVPAAAERPVPAASGEGGTQPVLDEGDAIILEDRPSKCSNRR